MRTILDSLHTLWVILKHEFLLYFVSPIIYLISAVLLFFAGLFFAGSLSIFNQGFAEPTMQYTLSPLAFLMMFVAPALTMRLIADEKRAGTQELLLTAPVRDWEVVVGKFLGAWAVITLFIVITLVYPFLLAWRGSPEQGVIVTGYVGLWLLSGTMLAVGVFASALTQHQLVSFVIGVGIILVLWLADLGNRLINNPTVATIFQDLTIREHYHSRMLSRGLIDLKDVVYLLGMMILFLFLATQVLGTRRWRA
jgi:ABC-2 type transport system permease protein